MSGQFSHIHDSHPADETWLVAAREFVTRRLGHSGAAPGGFAGIDPVEEAGRDEDVLAGEDA